MAADIGAEFRGVVYPPETVARYTSYPVTVSTVLSGQLKIAEWATFSTPVPDKMTDAVEFEAVLLTVRPPVRFPVVAGANVIFRSAVCPGARIRPVGMPVAL